MALDILNMDGLWQALPFLVGIQIGPRIRIGGDVGKIGQKLKVGAGKVLKKAAPFATFIPGVGPVMAAGLGAAGAAMDTSKGRVGLGDLAKGAISGGGTSGALGMVGKLGKIGQIGAKAGSVLSKIPGAEQAVSIGRKVGDFGDKVGDLGSVIQGTFPSQQADGDYTPQINAGEGAYITNPAEQDRYRPVNVAGGTPQEQGRGGWLQTALGFLDEHKDDILDYGTAAEQVAQNHRRNKFQDEAVGMARGDLARRQPLRDMGMAGLLDQSRPDLSSVFNDPDNPVGRYRRVQVGSRI